MARAASGISRSVASALLGLAGLTRTAIRPALGPRSGSSPSRLAAISATKKLMPVALPPGRARLATRPNSTGSTPTNGPKGIDQHGNAHGSRRQLVQEPKLLSAEVVRYEVDTRNVATWPVETGNEAAPNGVEARCEDNWYLCVGSLGRHCRRGVSRSDHCHLTAYQISCEVGQSIVLVLGPAILDRHVLALGVATFADTWGERSHKVCSARRRRAAENTDHRRRRLLRVRMRRPRILPGRE